MVNYFGFSLLRTNSCKYSSGLPNNNDNIPTRNALFSVNLSEPTVVKYSDGRVPPTERVPAGRHSSEYGHHRLIKQNSFQKCPVGRFVFQNYTYKREPFVYPW